MGRKKDSHTRLINNFREHDYYQPNTLLKKNGNKMPIIIF
jgi:hypothetical protein